ncbi:MAG: serine hydrolase [Alphaproteobacteria bacterium HGW-Alphaproteobacteria-16]|nr:MAG: serine hydrolase [Alphaproteobacteria bacterium HGW-Alphaproteobacteria-16]
MRLIAAASLFAFALLPLPAAAQDPARIDTVVRADADKGEFMGAVLVVKDGEVLLDRGYGSAVLEWNIPNDGDTKFRLGSVTKQFTAVAILLLQEQGKLRLDAPIKTYLTNAPAAWDKVTVHHLLTHTSGIPNFTGFPDYGMQKTLPTAHSGLIARFRDKPLACQPGEKWDYSNSGYVLLSAIVEQVSGISYAEFVTENIFTPLGMADSGYDSHAAILPRRATGYAPSAKGRVRADYIDMSIPQGAGGLYSTTHDLLKWHRGLYAGKLLKPASLKAYLTPFKDNYALGVSVVQRDGATTVSHSGGIEGFNTWLGYDPDRRITVAVLANLNGGAANRLGESLMTLARGGTVKLASERQAMPMTAAMLAPYVGTYDVSPSFGFTITAGDGHLIAQATRQDPLDLFPEKPDHFFFKAVDAQVVFTRDASGKVTSATLFQNGRELKAVRK